MSTRDDPAEVTRALLHQQQATNRAAAQQARLRGLSGSRTARELLADAWEALCPDRKRRAHPPAPQGTPPVQPNTYPTTYPPTY